MKPTPAKTTGTAQVEYEYLVMPDYGGAWCWMREPGRRHEHYGTLGAMGGVVGSDYGWGGKHPLSRKLVIEFARWQGFWQARANDLYEANRRLPREIAYRTFPWRAFHQDAHEMCLQMKQEVGPTARVFYLKPIEDPYSSENQWLEFFSDFSFAPPDDETEFPDENT